MTLVQGENGHQNPGLSRKELDISKAPYGSLRNFMEQPVWSRFPTSLAVDGGRHREVNHPPKSVVQED